jgi:hypothetical protein
MRENRESVCSLDKDDKNNGHVYIILRNSAEWTPSGLWGLALWGLVLRAVRLCSHLHSPRATEEREVLPHQLQ